MKQLLWFQNNLRIADHPLLALADPGLPTAALYCIPDRWLGNTDWGFPKLGPHRARFLRETLLQLQEGLQPLNIPLLVVQGNPWEVIPGLVKDHGVTHIFWQQEWLRDEREAFENTRKATPGVHWQTPHGNFLFHPDDLPFEGLATLPQVFTEFRKACEKRSEVRELNPIPQPFVHCEGIQPSPVPSLEDLGIAPVATDERSAFPFRGGYLAAKDRLAAYLWKTDNIASYKKTRNGLLGPDYSSKFSAWLANGSLSPREVYWEVRRYEKERTKNQDTYWMIFELIWRDYFRYISLKYGDRIFHLGGILGRELGWQEDQGESQAWIQGKTGEAFVDANMRELAATGWMSNRGRQNVASYWAKALQQDWRIGASWFESQLIDYDAHSNWGNWMYNSGVGNDPRDRKFNLRKQAAQYDPEHRFRDLWLPKKQQG